MAARAGRSSVLILGYGAIGEAIEARLTPFEVEVVRVARSAPRRRPRLLGAAGLLGDVDVVIVVVPLTGQTRGLVDAGFLARMKDDALLVNVARGPSSTPTRSSPSCARSGSTPRST